LRVGYIVEWNERMTVPKDVLLHTIRNIWNINPVCSHGSFPKNEVWEPNSGGSRISKWGDELECLRARESRRRGVGVAWMGCEEGCPTPTGDGAVSPPQKRNFQFWISNRRISVQTGCFLYSSPKAGLNAVLVRRRPKCQTLSICTPMNDRLLLLLDLRNCCYLCSRGSCLPSLIECLFCDCALVIDVVCRLLL